MKLEWERIEAGHYYSVGRNRGTGKDFAATVILIDGNWNLKMDGVFQGYFGRAKDAKQRAEDIVSGKYKRWIG